MKKTIALLLALVLCLSLCACGGGYETPETKGNEETNAPTESQVEATEDPAIEAEREKQYNAALAKLETSMFNGQSVAFKDAYDIFAQLGDYKDAQAYLARFTIIPNVCLMESYSKQDAFGQELYAFSWDYGYDAEGRIVFDRKDCATSFDPFPNIRTVYTYNDEGVLIEEAQVERTRTVKKATITYDASGNVLQRDYLDADGTASTQTFAYDDMGRLVTMMWVEAGSIYEYTYDESGLLVSAAGSGSGWKETREYAYDAYGNLITETIGSKWAGADKTETVKSYFYENGNLVRVEEKSAQGLVVITYTYGDYYYYTPEN